LISRAESSALFPELTEADFDDLDSNGDGFLSRAELNGTTGGCACPSPDEAKDFGPIGLVMTLLGLFESVTRIPGQVLQYIYGLMHREPDQE